MRSRILILSILAAVSALAVAALAWADSTTTLTGSAAVSPNKAGTPKHPQGVTLKVHTHWTTPADQDRPVVQKAIAYFPKGSLYNGGKYPKCDPDKMDRNGIAVCPKHSIMGKGTGTAWADTVKTIPQITIVNTGAKGVCLFTVLNNPAYVRKCVRGVIQKASGQWAYKLTLTVPPSLQVVAGVPIAVEDLTFTSGGKSYAKDWLATTSCPANKKWPFSVTTFYDNGGQSTFTSSTPCKK
jgi:hypothetical protein